MIQLTRRERRLAVGVLAVVAVWGVYGLAIEPVRTRIHTLERVIPEKRSELAEVQAKSVEYTALRKGLAEVQERMARQDPDFELLSYVESLLDEHKLTTHASDMDGYLGTVVKLTLNDIALRQLVEFLKAIEDSEVVAQVGSLHVHKDTQNEKRLDATLQIYSPGPDQAAVAVDWTGP